jgi:hypothetical protein
MDVRTFGVKLISEGPPRMVDDFYKYRGESLPAEGEVIAVMRFLRGRVIRARVTRVDALSMPQIAATQLD